MVCNQAPPPSPKILDWKGKTKYFVNGRLCCMCRDSKPGLFYLFKTILISLSSSPPLCVAAECLRQSRRMTGIDLQSLQEVSGLELGVGSPHPRCLQQKVKSFSFWVLFFYIQQKTKLAVQSWIQRIRITLALLAHRAPWGFRVQHSAWLIVSLVNVQY